ncbi:Na+ exclusion ABC transporter permease [Parageobacillus genomosp. 1]|uniref:Na+ exclusion ABC transporter permease n=1 Tax=Parageobacillus genomosp. 1 TaxID=1295642 RepID=A0ABC9VIK2_9BACL|nr:ABC transporter permease [Parageobacillus genomosp. 1]EZP78690.1 Na+ exclusion ABC transporter permease [Parageobacillus genomosp. 1]
MNKFWIVLGHTYVTKLKAKSFIITTIITSLFVFAMANIQHIIEFFTKDEKTTVAVIDTTGAFYEPLKAQLKQGKHDDLKLKKVTDSEEKAKADVRNGKWDALLILSADDKQLPKAAYYANTIADSDTPSKLEQVLQQLKTAIATAKIGLKQEQIAQLYEPVPFEKVALEKNAKTEEELNQARVLVYALLFAMYMFVLMYGGMISTEVATEKSSRVMEILVSSVSPIQQLFGKIIGVALLSLTQFVILFTVGFVALKSSGQELWKFLGFDHLPVSTFVYAIIFFLLGYFLYATLFAVLGSLVSRVEDVQQMITPVMIVVIAAFMIAMFGLNAPESSFIMVTSFIPFFTPMIMFLRVGLLPVPFWEVALSLVLLVATIGLLAFFGSKVYRGGVLMYGKAGSLKDMKKAVQLTKK